MSLGLVIRKARLEKGLTQEELGKIVGVQKSAIAKYENGRVVNIKRDTMQKIASVLNIRPSELIFEKSPEETADIHVRILTDFDLMDALSDYYELSSDNQKMVRDMIRNLRKE